VFWPTIQSRSPLKILTDADSYENGELLGLIALKFLKANRRTAF